MWLGWTLSSERRGSLGKAGVSVAHLWTLSSEGWCIVFADDDGDSTKGVESPCLCKQSRDYFFLRNSGASEKNASRSV